MADAPTLAGTLRELLGLLSPARKRQLALVLALMLAGALAEVAVIGSVVPFLAMLTGVQTTGMPNIANDLLGRVELANAAILFVLAVFVAAAIRLWLAWSSERVNTGIGHDLAMETQRRILMQPYSFHVQRHSSEIIASLEKINLLVFGVLHQAMATAVAAVIGIVILALLVAVDPVASLASVGALAIVYWAISRTVEHRLTKDSETFGTAYGERIRLVQESLGGIRDIIIDQSQPLYLESFRRIDVKFAQAVARSSFLSGMPRYLIEPAAVAAVASLAILLAGREGGLAAAIPALGAIALGGLRLLPLVQQAYRGWAVMAANRAVVGQVMELLRLPLPGDAPPAPALPFRDEVALDDVSFTYPGRHVPALSGISLRIARGERVALAGETGSGKSTLADLIMGLLSPDNGSVSVDGAPLKGGDIQAWQKNIAHVSQSIFLADASIARNIAFSVPSLAIDMDRVHKAAAEAGIAGFIEGLPEAYETKVGEHGARLSGGQRQRIAIARALYKDAPLLVLDEATNALDEATEARILANLFADKHLTILIIGHRPSALGKCDRVIRLAEGRIAAEP